MMESHENTLRERLRTLWEKRSARIGIGIAAVVLAVGIGVGIAVATSGGGGDDDDQAVASPTSKASATPETTGTAVGAGGKTPIAVSPGSELTEFDLAQRGAGVPARGEFLGDRLLIPSIGVDAPFTYKTVPYPNGQMPNPNGPSDVAYYDFSSWAGMGGVPGLGGNVVLAGHVDYINYGPAVFWDLDKLAVGDRVQIRMKDGSVIEYQIEFNKHIDAGAADWEAIVAGTAEESITLITCGGEFSAGHYSDRRILWGRRLT
jgi:LPXTG-site transpeptidase (sortase) family protein